MRLTLVVLIFALTPLGAQEPTDWQSWLNQGEKAFKSAQYPAAIAAFQKAVDLNPNNPTIHLYLATAYMVNYIPGAQSPENLDFARLATTEFQRTLELDPNNLGAALAMASLTYSQAQGITEPDAKSREFDEARDWSQRVLAIDPQQETAYYTLGVIDWQQVYPNRMTARSQIGMGPADPGPLTIPTVRLMLRAKFSAVIEDGVENLQKALELDPKYDDAMAYMNLLIRERADLRDTAAEYREDIAAADLWVQKAIATKKEKASASGQGKWMTRTGDGPPILHVVVAPPPPPPPPPPAPGSDMSAAASPQRIRVSGNVQAANLITKIEPVYPPLARQARIQGVVRFTAIIGKDGRVSNVQLMSGHPLLVESVRQAVNCYIYRPTLLNGNPIEVVTTVEVSFTLATN